MLSATSLHDGHDEQVADDCSPYITDATAGSSAALGSATGFAPPFPLDETFDLHSLRGADLTLYLDFNGHVTSGTGWNNDFNNGNDIISPAFDVDGNPNFFSAAEREYIQRIWQRVAEDFAPFNVNVTTADPGVEALRKVGAGDAQWGVRSIQTADQSWLTDDIGGLIGGIAYFGAYQFDTDTPVFTFNGSTSLSLFNEMAAADTHSHEVGHSIGLVHDGRDFDRQPPHDEEYYRGHGFGPTGWAPIMGAGFGQELSQWSRAEYPNAANWNGNTLWDPPQDDLLAITDPTYTLRIGPWSGISFRADDHGNTQGLATALTVGTSFWGPTFTGTGLIEQSTDVDVFFFDWGGGALSLAVDPFERGANLDIEARLYSAAGALMAISNPFSALNATLDVFLAAGQYYLHIDGVGKAQNGTDYGYSDYGSLGWYTITTPPPFEDRYEENDVRGLATDPLNNGGNWEGVWLSDINLPGRAQDEDWYVINVKAGQTRVRAELDFVDADGDLDLWLVDANGIPVAKSETVTDDEFIDFVVSAAGIYYLRVLPYANEVGNFYDLRWFDDVPVSTVSVSVSPAGTTEDGTANIVFTFSRVLDISKALTVNFTVSGTALFQSDYTVTGATTFTATTGSVTFAAGSSTATVVIDPKTDTLVELDEDVLLTVLAGPGYELGADKSATSLIRNDDQARVSINDVSVVEGNSGTTELVFTLTLNRAVDSGFQVLFNTADRNPVSASSMSDYQSNSGSITFTGTAGETQTITVLVNGDVLVEGNELFDLVLAGIVTNGRNIIRDRNRATGTIVNDDAPPLAPTNVQASDNRGDHVVITWEAVAGADSYSIYRGTVDDFGSATEIATGVLGTSYNDATATPGVTYFYWVKSVNTFGSTESGSDTGIVVPTVSIAVAPSSILEDAAGTVVFTFTRNGSTAEALTIKVLLGGSARLGVDYAQNGIGGTAAARTVTFAAGNSTATVVVNPTADTDYEYNETVVLRIAADAGYALGAKTAALTAIVNDDPIPRLGLITSPGAGFRPTVLVYDSTGQTVRLTINAYAPAFTRGVYVATGDVNNDGVFDVVVAPLSGVAPINVFSGIDGTLFRSFLPFSDNFNADLNPSFAGGFSLGVGDVDGDQYADIIVAPAAGAGPHVRVFSGKTGEILRTFAALGNENFKGGLNIAVGDTNNDGQVELFATPASAAGPFVRVYNPLTGAFINSFWALPDEATGRFTGGLTVAAGDLDGDGDVEVITGIASQGGPVVRTFNPLTGALVSNFLAFAPSDPQYSGGVNVGVSDFDGDGKAEIVVASRTQQSAIRIFDGLTGALVTSVPAPYASFSGGVFATGEVAPTVALPAGKLATSPMATKAAFLSLSSSTQESEFKRAPLPEPIFASSPRLDDLFADERQLDALLTA